MKPKTIKKSILSLNKKAVANLTEVEMSKLNGGFEGKPPTVNNQTTIIETAIDCPCTHFCEPTTK
jgi:hypothetical protein